MNHVVAVELDLHETAIRLAVMAARTDKELFENLIMYGDYRPVWKDNGQFTHMEIYLRNRRVFAFFTTVTSKYDNDDVNKLPHVAFRIGDNFWTFGLENIQREWA